MKVGWTHWKELRGLAVEHNVRVHGPRHAVLGDCAPAVGRGPAPSTPAAAPAPASPGHVGCCVVGFLCGVSALTWYPGLVVVDAGDPGLC